VKSFTVTRTLNAPRELVFRAWTEPEQLTWFFNPGHPTQTPTTVDLQPGGAWRQHMVIDDETDYMTGGIYLQIVAPERLVFAFGAVGGWPELDPEHPEDGPIATVTLVEIDADTTEMTATLVVPDSHLHPHMEQGWTDTLERLVAQLA